MRSWEGNKPGLAFSVLVFSKLRYLLPRFVILSVSALCE